jgi:hypothetical protein
MQQLETLEKRRQLEVERPRLIGSVLGQRREQDIRLLGFDSATLLEPVVVPSQLCKRQPHLLPKHEAVYELTGFII